MLILFSFLWKSFHIPLSWFYTGNWFFKPREIKKITFKDYCTPGSYILLLETVGQRIPESQYILMTKLIFRVQLVYYLYGHKKHWTLSNEPLFWLWFCDLLQYIFSLSYFLSCSKYEVKHLETLGKISLHNFISLRSIIVKYLYCKEEHSSSFLRRFLLLAETTQCPKTRQSHCSVPHLLRFSCSFQ